MSDADLRAIFATKPGAIPGEKSETRVPWWAMLLAFAVAFLVFSVFAALIFGRMSGAFGQFGDGWSEIAIYVFLLAAQFGAGIVLVFAILRTLMARMGRAYWVFFVLIWVLGPTLGFNLPFGPLAFALAGTGMVWGTLLAVPVLVTATVHYWIERVFRREL